MASNLENFPAKPSSINGKDFQGHLRKKKQVVQVVTILSLTGGNVPLKGVFPST